MWAGCPLRAEGLEGNAAVNDLGLESTYLQKTSACLHFLLFNFLKKQQQQTIYAPLLSPFPSPIGRTLSQAKKPPTKGAAQQTGRENSCVCVVSRYRLCCTCFQSAGQGCGVGGAQQANGVSGRAKFRLGTGVAFGQAAEPRRRVIFPVRRRKAKGKTRCHGKG